MPSRKCNWKGEGIHLLPSILLLFFLLLLVLLLLLQGPSLGSLELPRKSPRGVIA